jgi:hypothetical protein
LCISFLSLPKVSILHIYIYVYIYGLDLLSFGHLINGVCAWDYADYSTLLIVASVSKTQCPMPQTPVKEHSKVEPVSTSLECRSWDTFHKPLPASLILRIWPVTSIQLHLCPNSLCLQYSPYCIFLYMVLGFELRVSCLLGRCSIT